MQKAGFAAGLGFTMNSGDYFFGAMLSFTAFAT